MEGRANAIGILTGQGGGKSLISNSHMDSEQGMPLRVGQELPPKPSTSADSCSIYVDVRVPPPVDFVQVERELKEVVLSQGLDGEVECFMSRKGYEGKNVEPLVDAIRSAHEGVRGTQPLPVDTPETSMWRDINIFNEVGIPAATFGMPRKSSPNAVQRFVEVRDIMDAAKMYALVALKICS